MSEAAAPSDAELREIAFASMAKAQATFASRPGQHLMGCVGAALITADGNLFTGVVLNFQVGIGFCAEASAVAEMIKNGESRIARICAVTIGGAILPPCGRCRELLFQVDAANLDTAVTIPQGTTTLRELLPNQWQQYWDVPLT